MPCCFRNEIMAEAPRSLNDPVGENHSSLKRQRLPRKLETNNGVQPSPNDTGGSRSIGKAARYLHIDRSVRRSGLVSNLPEV